MIRIRQVKTDSYYEKPISQELVQFLRKAMEYTRERHGNANYVFVNSSNTNRSMQYGYIQEKVITMIQKEDLRDDNG